jgi:hypothetical protein
MAGESPQHSSANVNLIAEVVPQIKETFCQPFSPNMKVRSGERTSPVSLKGLFSYADLTIVCGEPQFHDEVGDVLVNPKVIFEILPPSIGLFDRGEKFRRFRTYNDSLTDYVLISQVQPLIEHFQRQTDGQWPVTEVKGLKGELYIASIDCRLKLSAVYNHVSFQSQEPADGNSADSVEAL